MDERPDLALTGVSCTQVYSFGCNDEGALGRDTSVEGSEMVPGKVELQEKVVQVSAGDSHTAALTEDGRVFLWGSFRVRLGLEDVMGLAGRINWWGPKDNPSPHPCGTYWWGNQDPG